MTINHDDVRRKYPDAEILWVALADRVVHCRVRLQVLIEGSIDPLVLALLGHLDVAQRPLTLAELCDIVGVRGAGGRRVVAEILHVLRRSVEVVDSPGRDGEPVFQRSRGGLGFSAETHALEADFNYIPRTGLLRRNLKAVNSRTLDMLPFWEPPDTAVHYEYSALTENIRSASEAYYGGKGGSRHLKSLGYTEAPREEVLQRSRLLVVYPELLQAEVVNVFWQATSKSAWHIHRAYVVQHAARRDRGWKIEVYVVGGPPQPRYTRYLTNLCTDERVLRNLRSRCDIIQELG
jgi:hypothetical protein